MSLPSSSISSSEAAHTTQLVPGIVADTVRVVLAMLLTWMLLDVAVAVLVSSPHEGTDMDPQSIEHYFEYGRSVEGKLDRLVGPSDTDTARIAHAGWLDPQLWDSLPDRARVPGGLLMAVYGSSFAQLAAEAMAQIDPAVTTRFVGGPAAPVSHSYAAYLLDRKRHDASVVVLGIVASSVRGLTTMTGATWMFERPAPYTYPRYDVDGDRLEAIWPSITSLEELRRVRQDPAKWSAFVEQLAEHDTYFEPFLFHETALDRSAFVRFLRRGWAQRRDRALAAGVHGPEGFNPGAPEVKILRRLVVEFAEAVRQDRRLPVILLLHDRGYADHLFRLLESTVRDTGAVLVSSHEIIPAGDPQNFVADGHFTEPATRRLAGVTLGAVRDALGGRAQR